MMGEARELTFTTRDDAPRPGEKVFRTTLRRSSTGESGDLPVIQPVRGVVSHWPLMGLWEVEVDGLRKPLVVIAVKRDTTRGADWTEVAGR